MADILKTEAEIARVVDSTGIGKIAQELQGAANSAAFFGAEQGLGKLSKRRSWVAFLFSETIWAFVSLVTSEATLEAFPYSHSFLV